MTDTDAAVARSNAYSSAARTDFLGVGHSAVDIPTVAASAPFYSTWRKY